MSLSLFWGFDLSVWYQVLFYVNCLRGTTFWILCSFLFAPPFLYLLVLNVFWLFFVYPFLFQFHPCFLCFSVSIDFFFCVRQRVFQFWSTHFSSSSSFVFLWRSRLLSCITLFTSMWQLVRTKLATNTIIKTKLSIISKFWKVSLCCHFFYLSYQNFWNWPTV